MLDREISLLSSKLGATEVGENFEPLTNASIEKTETFFEEAEVFCALSRV